MRAARVITSWTWHTHTDTHTHTGQTFGSHENTTCGKYFENYVGSVWGSVRRVQTISSPFRRGFQFKLLCNTCDTRLHNATKHMSKINRFTVAMWKGNAQNFQSTCPTHTHTQSTIAILKRQRKDIPKQTGTKLIDGYVVL